MSRLGLIRYIPASRLDDYQEAQSAGNRLRCAATTIDVDSRFTDAEIVDALEGTLGVHAQVTASSEDRFEILAITPGDTLLLDKLMAVESALKSRQAATGPRQVIVKREHGGDVHYTTVADGS